MSDVNRILTSLLLSHAIRRYVWRIVVIEVSYILERIFVFLEERTSNLTIQRSFVGAPRALISELFSAFTASPKATVSVPSL